MLVFLRHIITVIYGNVLSLFLIHRDSEWCRRVSRNLSCCDY